MQQASGAARWFHRPETDHRWASDGCVLCAVRGLTIRDMNTLRVPVILLRVCQLVEPKTGKFSNGGIAWDRRIRHAGHADQKHETAARKDSHVCGVETCNPNA